MTVLPGAPFACLWSLPPRALIVTTHAGCWQGITILPPSLRVRPYHIRLGLS